MSKKMQYSKSLLVFIKALLIVNIAIFIVLASSVAKISSSDHTESGVKEEAKRIANNCFNKNRNICYKNEFTKITISKGLSFAEKTLYALQDLDLQTRHCHILSHEISKAATRKEPSKWKKLLEEVNPDVCGAGFLHGILEAHVGYEPNFRINSKFIDETCYKGQKNFKERTCSHILGHLVLVDTEGKMGSALGVCDRVNRSFSLDCYNGVFMEDSFKLALAEHGFADIPVRDEERMIRQKERCLKYDREKGVACWTDMAEIFAELYNYDPVKVFESCNQAPEEAQRNHCYFKGVIHMAVSPDFDNEKKLLSECTPYEKDEFLYKHCTGFIISSLMHYSPKFSDRAIKLCTNITDMYKEFCFKDFGEKLKMNVQSRTERESFCQGTPGKYKKYCVGE